MKILATIWFTGRYGHCGIVLVEDILTGDRKAYLGVHTGTDEERDRDLIAYGGVELTAGVLERVLRHLKKEEVPGDKT